MTGAGSVSIVQYLDHAKDTRLVELNFEGLGYVMHGNGTDVAANDRESTDAAWDAGAGAVV